MMDWNEDRTDYTLTYVRQCLKYHHQEQHKFEDMLIDELLTTKQGPLSMKYGLYKGRIEGEKSAQITLGYIYRLIKDYPGSSPGGE